MKAEKLRQKRKRRKELKKLRKSQEILAMSSTSSATTSKTHEPTEISFSDNESTSTISNMNYARDTTLEINTSDSNPELNEDIVNDSQSNENILNEDLNTDSNLNNCTLASSSGTPTVKPPGTISSVGTVEGLHENLETLEMNNIIKIRDRINTELDEKTRISDKTGKYKQLSLMNYIQNDSNNLSVTHTVKKIFCSTEPSSVLPNDKMDDSSDLNIYTNSEIEKKCKKITSYFMKYTTRKSPTCMTSSW